MTERSALRGAPCWIDLLTSDPAAAERFYSDLFGWAAEHNDEEKYGGYISFSRGERAVAGAMRNDGSAGAPDGWNIYLATDDVEATTKAAAEHGGAVYMGPMEVPETGHMAMVAGPGGGAVGAWQAIQFGGFDAVAEDGLPGWFELHTRRYADDVRFYADVFGWETHVASDTPELRYTTLGSGDQQAAGIMDASALPEDAPMGWKIYFGVDSADATAARAVELGGTVVDPPVDTPYGRLATLADPSGVQFKLIQGPAS
ncbi:MAG: VOC family protein [Nocardioides sp.]